MTAAKASRNPSVPATVPVAMPAAATAKAATGTGDRAADQAGTALVGIIMGSQSDWPTMQRAVQMLDELGVPYETRIVSAHRTPDRLVTYAKTARARGLKVIIAGAGGAAHLPGMTAAMTTLPVLGVPVQSRALSGQDSLLSIVQMPAGVPVGTLAIGEAGAANAGLLAAQILSLGDPALAQRIEAWRAQQTAKVAEQPETGATATMPAATVPTTTIPPTTVLVDPLATRSG